MNFFSVKKIFGEDEDDFLTFTIKKSQATLGPKLFGTPNKFDYPKSILKPVTI